MRFVFILGCTGSLLMCGLQLRWAGAPLHCGAQASRGGFSWCRAQALGGPAPVVAAGSVVAALRLYSLGSVVAAHRPRCSVACGILPDQGSNLRPLHWQADAHPLCRQGSLNGCILLIHRRLLFPEVTQIGLRMHPHSASSYSNWQDTGFLLFALALFICDEDLPQQFSVRTKERNTFEKYVGSCEIPLVWPLLWMHNDCFI